MAKKRKQHSFLYRNSLTIVLLCFFLASIVGQVITGRHEYNEMLEEHGEGPVMLSEYMRSGHFLQVTFENWESEFLQMGMYVVLTIFLRQLGSSESKALDETEEVDREPDPSKKDAPWPVKRGGFALKIYKSSLSLIFALLFLSSFALHAIGSYNHYKTEQQLKSKPYVGPTEYLKESRFWFESFQNWQSEFIAVISIVVLSIYFRQQGSPESKPVDASYEETGSA
jgi:hypothetical protein